MKNTATAITETIIHTACGLDLSPIQAEDHRYAYCFKCAETDKAVAARIARAQAFYASQRAIDALCPACKQPQNAPSCERREHWV